MINVATNVAYNTYSATSNNSIGSILSVLWGLIAGLNRLTGNKFTLDINAIENERNDTFNYSYNVFKQAQEKGWGNISNENKSNNNNSGLEGSFDEPVDLRSLYSENLTIIVTGENSTDNDF